MTQILHNKQTNISPGISLNYKTIYPHISFTVMRVPVLTIVAEGDLDTIETVHQVLKKHLPVLVLKGSGKAADFIANFMEECKE